MQWRESASRKPRESLQPRFPLLHTAAARELLRRAITKTVTVKAAPNGLTAEEAAKCVTSGLRAIMAGCQSLDGEAKAVLGRQFGLLLGSIAPTRVEFDLFDEEDGRLIGRVEQWFSQAEVEERWLGR